MAIDSQYKQLTIQLHIQSSIYNQFWIGIQQTNYSIGNYNYFWIHSLQQVGTNNYTFWPPSLPYDYKFRCVGVLSNSNSHSWANYPCSDTYQSVCELNIGKINMIRGYLQHDVPKC